MTRRETSRACAELRPGSPRFEEVFGSFVAFIYAASLEHVDCQDLGEIW